MKKLSVYLVVVLWAWTVLYLGGSFAFADFDPRTWGEPARVFISIFAVCVPLVASTAFA